MFWCVCRCKRELVREIALALYLLHVIAALKIDPEVWKTLDRESKTNIIISFRSPPANKVPGSVGGSVETFDNRGQMLNLSYVRHKRIADQSQGRVLGILEELIEAHNSSASIVQLVFVNELIVRDVDQLIVKNLSTCNCPLMAEINDDDRIPTDLPPIGPYTDTARREKWPWGLTSSQFEVLWELSGNHGEGTVVGIVDTGVRGSHEALRDNFRSDYGWFEPGVFSKEPHDGWGHGTHVAGIIAGKNYGVAPKAQWIACRAIKEDHATASDMKECMDWMCCPTDTNGQNRDCSKAPKVVNCSWTSSRGGFLDRELLRWVLHGIVPIFASGNDGENGCSSAAYPGTSHYSISVASVDQENRLADSSSRGPGPHGLLKPDVAAPGVDIPSPAKASDTDYGVSSGTSFAAPHVAGLAAIYFSIFPNNSVEEFRDALTKGVLPVNSVGESCGGVSDLHYPNNHVGYGRINAVRFYEAITGVSRGGLSSKHLHFHLPLISSVQFLPFLVTPFRLSPFFN